MCISDCKRISNMAEENFDIVQNKQNINSSPKPSSGSTKSNASSKIMFSAYISIMCMFLFLTSTVDSASIIKRSPVEPDTDLTSPMTTTEEPKICYSSTPCGWAVYIPISRRVDYYMKNICECPKGRECLKSEDDLSVSAYVYRCKEKSNTTTKKESDST